jgi:two-component system sensor histidine kinase PilS (NtrC family)
METPALNQTNSTVQLKITGDTENWRSLRHFNYYRLALAMTLLLFFYTAVLGGFLGRLNPEAFLVTAVVFFISSFFYVLSGLRQIPAFKTQVILTNSSDIVLITLMMHFSGGLVSGLGMLLIINIAATGTFLQSRESYFFAAIASMGVLFEQTYSQLNDITSASAYSAAGILGIVFFGSSMLASILSQRLEESEALASQRKADLHSLEKLNEHIIQNMRTGIIVVDNDGHIQMANSSAESLLGEVSLQNHPLLENVFPALDARFLEWQDQPQMHQKPIRREQGLPDIQPGFRKLDDSSTNPGDSLIFLEDATQLNQRYQQMKLASLGRLTASIAHEIRNPLSAINHASQLLNESELDTSDHKLTQIITTQVQRLDKIIENVLSLSRQQQGRPESLNLHDWLINFREEFIQINDIDIEQFSIEIHPKDLCVLFDSSHLYQVVNNLCSNIILHHDKNREDICIALVGDHDHQRDQPYLDIIDNGPGIDPDQVEQIFDPFFTTNSRGTGLGLFISKEIIESNRGKIRYIENNRTGSCFRIYFLAV